MRLHLDNIAFQRKAEGAEIGGIKSRFTNPASIKDITVRQLAKCITDGRTVQPGVCPFSERSRAAGKKGTVKEDFTEQTVFMNDVDNKRRDVPIETPAHVAEVLAAYGLKAAFMYDTFNSTAENERFRFGVVSDEEFTDKTERDRVQAALIAAFPQSDTDCINADRIFFGTNKGLIEGFTNLDAVCRKADLLALADAMQIPENPEQADSKLEWVRFGETIPTGQRHGTLVSAAATLLTKYGICDKAYDLFIQRAAQCEEPKPDAELQKIWKDACKYYEERIATNPDYIPPAEYAVQEFSDIEKPKRKKKSPLSYHTGLAQAYINEHTYIVGVQHLCKGGFGNDTVYEYVGGVWNNYTFDVPENCRLANEEYRRVNSTVRTFLDECCKPFDPANIKEAQTTGKFWNGFKQWCRDSNINYVPQKAEFRRELALIAGVDEKELDRHTKDGNFYPYVIKWEIYKECSRTCVIRTRCLPKQSRPLGRTQNRMTTATKPI